MKKKLQQKLQLNVIFQNAFKVFVICSEKWQTERVERNFAILEVTDCLTQRAG